MRVIMKMDRAIQLLVMVSMSLLRMPTLIFFACVCVCVCVWVGVGAEQESNDESDQEIIVQMPTCN